MFTHEHKIRVRYGETDRMGFVYYGHYATYYETGRVEALRALGIPYRGLEDEGVLLPVIDFTIKYLKPAYYDDELTIRTLIKEVPRVKLIFNYETFNADNVLLNTGQTTLVFVDKATGKPILCPARISDTLNKAIHG